MANVETQKVEPRRISWKLLFGGLLLAAAAQAVAMVKMADDRTHQMMVYWAVSLGTASFLLVWWVFLSGMRWSYRLGGLAVVVAVLASLRVDGFSGDMIPQIGLRFLPTPENRAEAFFRKQQTVAPTTPDFEPDTDASVEWTQFRGIDRLGVAESEIRTNWNEQPPEPIWKHPVGLGWASFAIYADRAITMEQRGDTETVVCYEASTGDVLWTHASPGQRFSEAMGGDGPRATPTIDGGHVYALGATGQLSCLSLANGDVEWTADILTEADVKNLNWGMSGSPLVVDELVIVQPGGHRQELASPPPKGRALIAFDKQTGDIRWRSGDYMGSYASPRLATIDGVPQVLVFDAIGPAGYSLATGEELWHAEWWNSSRIHVAMPFEVDEGLVLAGVGYGKGTALFRIKHEGGEWSVADEPVWTTNRLKLKFSDPVLIDGFLYGLDERILVCIDGESGKMKWKGGRYGYGQLIRAGNHLIVLSERGKVVLVEATPEGHNEVASFQAISGKTWNVPALSEGRLFVRNAHEAACFDLSIP